MKRIFCLTVLLLLLSSASSVELGVIIGRPSGLSLKINRIHLEAGYQRPFEGAYSLHLAYEIPFKIDFGNKNILPMYFGIGIFSHYEENFQMGIKFPLGIKFWLGRNLILFGELSPAYNLIDNPGFEWYGGLGLAVWFKIRS